MHTRPNTHTTLHTHSQYPYTLTNPLIHMLSPSLAHTQIHTHSHTAIFTLTHTPSLVPAPSLAPSSWPLCLLFLCQERPSLAPSPAWLCGLLQEAFPPCAWPAPGAFCTPAHVTCIPVLGDRSHAWHTAGAHSMFTGSLFTVGGCWEGGRGPLSPRNEVWSFQGDLPRPGLPGNLGDPRPKESAVARPRGL